MSKILMDADQKLQITGNYLTGWDEKIQKAKGYCALGMLACKTKNVSFSGYVSETNEWIGATFGIGHDEMYDFKTCPACKDGVGCGLKLCNISCLLSALM